MHDRQAGSKIWGRFQVSPGADIRFPFNQAFATRFLGFQLATLFTESETYRESSLAVNFLGLETCKYSILV